MLTLRKIIGRGVNVPEPQRLPLSEATAVEAGMAYIYKDKVLLPFTATSSLLPTHIAKATEPASLSPLLFPVSEDMVFSIPLAEGCEEMTEGGEYLLSPDGTQLSATRASASHRGVILLDKCGASKKGEPVLVHFPRV